MPLPDGAIPISAGDPSRPPRSAYLVRFPEDAWAQFQSSSGGITLSFDGGMSLSIPNSAPIPLNPQSTGSASELHLLFSSELIPYALASTRLSAPITSAGTSRAADKLRAQNEAIDREKKDRADRVNGIKKEGAAMGRTTSNQQMGGVKGARSASASVGAAGGGGGPTVPLKTRVVQLLALGPMSVDDIVARVGMAENEVMRVVRVVGRETSDGSYTLQPSKYAQVKIGTWKYTYSEKLLVIRLAREAFDELSLPSDADERAELDRKEAEGFSGGSSSGSSSEKVPDPLPVPTPVSARAVAPAQTRIASPSPAKREQSKEEKKAKVKGGLGLIGKQKAKFAAEKRAASLPNAKKVDGTASPRLVPKASIQDTSSVEPSNGKRKREEEKPKTDSSTLASSSEESRGRPREREKLDVVKAPKAVVPNEDRVKRKRPSRDYSSSDSEPDPPTIPPPTPTRPTSLPTFKRKPPPSELRLAGAGAPTPTQAKHANPAPDPEALRERYEELFPAYELLTKKLADVHHAAEEGEEAEVVVDESEVEKMVARWERWHRELEGIRRWFGEA